MKMGGTYQVCLQTREVAFAINRVARHKRLADDEAEDGISQKFELLVVCCWGVVGVSVFERKRFMRERADQQFSALESMTNPFFQLLRVRGYHFAVYFVIST